MGTLSVDKLMKTSTGAAEFTLPATDGTVDQVMKTDGAGQLGFTTVSADPTMGGDLSGLSSNAQIVALAVDTAEIAANAVDGTKIAMGSDAQGDVLYYNGTNYVRLAAGTSGYALLTQGASTNPVWGQVSTYGTYSASIRKNANQSVPNNTSPVCTFEVTDFDSSPSTNMADLTNNRVYFRAEGTYLVISNTKWGNGASNGQRYTFVKYYDSSAPASLYLGNAYGFPYMSPTGTGSQFWTVIQPVIIDAGAVGDFVSCEINQNCGQAVDVNGDADYPIDGPVTNLTVMRIE